MLLGLLMLITCPIAPEFTDAQINTAIYSISKKHLDLGYKIQSMSKDLNLHPFVLVALINQESTFRHSARSRTGDIGLTQINYEIWSKELLRVKSVVLSKSILKKDMEYALEITRHILNIIKTKHSKDRRWVARYHSRSYKEKVKYIKAIQKQFNNITL